MSQQQEVFEAHVGNARRFELYLEDPPPAGSPEGTPGTPITGAVVNFSVYLADRTTPLPGTGWPLVASDVGSGWYVVTTPAAVQWAHMTAYSALITFGTETRAVPPIVAYDRTLQQPTQRQLRRVAQDAGLSI